MDIKPSHYQFLRFLVVGGVNTLFGYGVFAFFLFLRFHYAVASFLATVMGILFNFHTVSRFVFSSGDRTLIFKFVGVYACTYVVGTAGIKVLSVLGLGYYLGGAVLLLPMAVMSFFLNRTYVFKRPTTL